MSDVTASPVIEIVAALGAAALYAVAYISFVRLLRFPRNWVPFSPWEVLTTGLVVVFVVAWVSWTPDGPALLSGANLVISSAFIAAAFCIIAAPALAFRPSSRAVEFLARHADHAGLWLTGPALVGCLTVPSSRLQGMLTALVVIECSWSLRQHRAWRRRRLYPLNLSDRSVLEKQSQGELSTFRSRYGIRELVLSGDVVRWKGCVKSTPPCPFNLYINRLGLNTAPCCREHLRDVSHYVASCLREVGAVHWLEGGSLLGAVRENGALLEWEDDVDISVLLDEDMTWERLSTALKERAARDGYYIDLFKKRALIAVSFDPPKPRPFRWERNRFRGEIRIDIAAYRLAVSYGEAVLERRSHKGEMPATESGGYGVPKGIVLPTSTIGFMGDRIACPSNPHAYLRVLYGDFEEVEYTYIDSAAADARRKLSREPQRGGESGGERT